MATFTPMGVVATIKEYKQFLDGLKRMSEGMQKTGKSSLKMGQDATRAGAALDKTRKPLLSLNNVSGLLTKSLGALGIAWGVREVIQFGKETQEAYQRLAAGKGALLATVGSVENYNEAIGKAREATRGMVSEGELASSVNVLMASGLAQSADEAAQLVNAGNILTGVFSANGATLEKFTRLLASGNQVLLDNFGLTLDMVQARQREIEATQGLVGQQARLAAVRSLLLESADKYKDSVSDAEIASRAWQAAVEDLKAAIGEELAPAASGMATTLTQAVRALTEGKAALAEQREEIFETSDSFTEYTHRLRQAGLALDLNRKQFDANKSAIEAGKVTVEGLEHEQRKLTDATRAAAEAAIKQEKAMFREEQAAEKSRQQRLRSIESIKEWTKAQEEAAKKAVEVAQKLSASTASYFLGLREAQQDAITSEQEFNASIAEIRTGGAQQQAEAGEALSERLVKLAEEREEKLHWVLTGAHARTQQENDEALAFWSAHYDELEAEARAGYEEQNTAIRGKLAEREAALRASHEKQQAEQAAALERMKLQAALTVLETTGQLEAFTGGLATSASDAAALIESGVLPVSEDMALGIQNIIGELATRNEESTTQAAANAELLSQAIAGDLQGTVQPAIDETDRKFGVVTSQTIPDLETRHAQAAVAMQEDLVKVAGKLTGEGGVKPAAEAAAGAIGSGFKSAGEKIEDKLIPKLKELVKWLEKVEAAAKRAGDATRDMGGAAGGAGAPAFQHGTPPGGFVVPPGFPRDTFPIRVSSGELVRVIPRGGDVDRSSVTNVNNYFNQTVSTRATARGVVNEFEVMRALVG